MKLPRRRFIKLAAGAAVLPALSLRRALAQPASNPACVPEPTPSERAAMARIAHAFMQKYDVPALSVAVGYAGEIVHRAAFGLADRERNEAVTPMHLFRIASVSKMIWNLNKADNWWHNGSLPGTTTIAVRTHRGFCWAAFTNTSRANSQIDDDLDKLNWDMVGAVKSWPA